MSDLKTLETFARIVELGSFSDAARESGLKQSTVSKRLASLEAELGVQLIERTTRTQRVTEAGRQFYERVLDVLAAHAEAIASVSSPAAASGRLRVSAPVVFGQLFVAPLVPAFAAAYPKLELELSFADRYIDVVAEGFDVAIRVGRPVDTSARGIAVTETPRRLVASPALAAALSELATPKDLGRAACLIHSGLDTAATWRFTRGERNHVARVRGVLAADNSMVLRELARSGVGVALLASWLVDGDIESGDLVRLLPDYEPPTAAIQLILPPSRRVHPRTRVFVDHWKVALRDAVLASGQVQRSGTRDIVEP